MALKINITLDSHEDFNLLVESIEHYRALLMKESRAEGITPVQKTHSEYRARQLQALKEKVTK